MPILSRLAESDRDRIIQWLNALVATCGVASLFMLAVVVGWPLSAPVKRAIQVATTTLLSLFVFQELLRLVLQERLLEHLKNRRVELLLVLAMLFEMAFGRHLASWLDHRLPDVSGATLALIFLGINQLALVCVIALRAIRHVPLLHSRTLSSGQVFILSFAALIALGTLLLKSTHASPSGLPWIDALFLSTSAVCVTGLSPVDISTALTPQGHWILLGLIQLGGLGVMTITYFFAYFINGEINLRSRIALQDLLSEDNLGQIGTVLALVIGFTAMIELSGALLIHASLSGSPQAPENLPFFALFHAVSAFCNAGFSTLGAGLADPRVSTQTLFTGTIMGLIVLGGLGFPVVKGFWVYLSNHLAYRIRWTDRTPARLPANARIVLTTTAFLLVGGTAGIWLTEFAWGHGPAAGSTWWTALFHAVTARTAGFNITPVQELLPASAVLVMMLMFIGGSPSSTAGGIKTSTLAVAFFSLRRVILGRKDMEAFGRRFSEDLSDRALAIILVAGAFLTLVIVALCALQPAHSPFDLAFEAVSALGTVGLSRNLTPQLGAPAKLVLIMAMFIGRIGVLTFVVSFVRSRVPPAFRYPETTIVLN